MKLYRFSPVKTKEKLLEAIEYMHFTSYKLCKKVFDQYFPVAGNVGFFCHYEDEYEILTNIRKKLTEESDNFNQKYFRLHEPITFRSKDEVPSATYTHLYIRKPDPYRHFVGDIDYYLEDSEYEELKERLKNGEKMPGARIFPRPDLDMIEVYDPDIDVISYVSDYKMTQDVHVKLSDHTNL